jgi:acetyl esterase/lipase
MPPPFHILSSSLAPFEDDDLAEARQLNAKLAKAPRFRIRNRFTPMLLQSLLRLSQLGSDRAAKRSGLTVEQCVIEAGGQKVRARVLRPAGQVRGVVLDIHGGGWVIGNARMNNALNTATILACNVAVVSIEYRLAGRTPIQGVMDDCLAAALWVLQGDGIPKFRGLPVIVVGESAGGHLAAATLLRLKQWPALFHRIAGTVLYYGVYDIAGTDSVRRAGPDTLVLDGPGMLVGLQRLTAGMSDAERRTAPLSPLYGDLENFPPALMFVGERDPLLDDTVRMAERWRTEAPVELHLIPEAPHGFIHFRTRMAAKVLSASHGWIAALLDN